MANNNKNKSARSLATVPPASAGHTALDAQQPNAPGRKNLYGSSNGFYWKSNEEKLLLDLASSEKNSRGQVNWPKVSELWLAAAATGGVKVRTTGALKSRLRRLKPSMEVDEMVQVASDEASQDVMESAVDIAVASEASYDRNAVRELFAEHLKKALSSTERKPVGKLRARARDDLFTWVDEAILDYMAGAGESCKQITHLNAAVYAAAKTVKVITDLVPNAKRRGIAAGLESLREKTHRERKFIGWITQELQRRRTQVHPTVKQVAIIRTLRGFGLKTHHDLEVGLEGRKLQLSKLSKEIKLREDELTRKQVRKAPMRRLLDPLVEESEEGLGPNQIRNYWEPIVGRKQKFTINENLQGWSESWKHLQEHKSFDQDKAFKTVMTKVKAWRAPGPDGIEAFWWKTLPSAQNLSQVIFNRWLDDARALEKIPKWFGRGRVVLLPKPGDPKEPGNYRPIACLNTQYKICTAYLAEKWRGRIETILPEEQLAMKRGVWGCIHAHAIDQAVRVDVASAKRSAARSTGNKKNAAQGWVDFSKAFDSVPHSTIRWLLRKSGLDQKSRELYGKLMELWTVKYEVRLCGKVQKSRSLRIKCGVLQGDTLSPMLFCLAVAPISWALKEHMRSKDGSSPMWVNHLYYMDDLKIYAESPEELEKGFGIVQSTASAMNLKMNLSKCAASWIAARDDTFPGLKDATLSHIPALGTKDLYKYLGVEQGSGGIASHSLFARLRSKVLNRVKLIWDSELTFRQKVNATNVAVIPVIKYGFMNCFAAEARFNTSEALAKEIDHRIVDILVDANAKFAKTNVERVYANAQDGGYGLQSIVTTLHEATVYAGCYAQLHPELGLARYHLKRWHNRGKRTVFSDLTETLSKYDSVAIDIQPLSMNVLKVGKNGSTCLKGAYDKPRDAARSICELMSTERSESMKRIWLEKSTTTNRLVHDEGLNWADSILWMKAGLLNSRSVRDAVAVQEGQLFTKTHPGHQGNKNCRRCSDPFETIAHVVSGCPTFRATLMIDRHDSVARTVHAMLCQKLGLRIPNWKARIPATLVADGIKLSWAPKVVASTVRHNCPDMILEMPAKVFIIEVTVAWHGRLSKAYELKYSKYAVNSTLDDKDKPPYPAGPSLQRDLAKLLAKPVETIPIVVGTCGEVDDSLRTGLKTLGFTGKFADDLIAKIGRSAVLGTDRVLRAHLDGSQDS